MITNFANNQAPYVLLRSAANDSDCRHAFTVPVTESATTDPRAHGEKRAAPRHSWSMGLMPMRNRPPAQIDIANRCTTVAMNPTTNHRPVALCPPAATTAARPTPAYTSSTVAQRRPCRRVRTAMTPMANTKIARRTNHHMPEVVFHTERHAHHEWATMVACAAIINIVPSTPMMAPA